MIVVDPLAEVTDKPVMVTSAEATVMPAGGASFIVKFTRAEPLPLPPEPPPVMKEASFPLPQAQTKKTQKLSRQTNDAGRFRAGATRVGE